MFESRSHHYTFEQSASANQSVQMDSACDPNLEINELIKNEQTPAVLREALQFLSRLDAKTARDVADKLDEVCERRWALTLRLEAHKWDRASKALSSKRLNEDCDALTSRLMKFLSKQTADLDTNGTSQLIVVAAARTLICTSVLLSGLEEGLSAAHVTFEGTFDELEPLLRELDENGVEDA